MDHLKVVRRLIRFARKRPVEKFQILRLRLAETEWFWKVISPGQDRTIYIIGLFGTGRVYLNELLTQHIGERAKYFARNHIRFRTDQTRMIYSYHATIKHLCWGYEPPTVTWKILEAVQSGVADLIFIYRHPLDSLLSNWIWFREVVHGRPGIFITDAYDGKSSLCAFLEQNFADFKAFADGDPEFYASKLAPLPLSLSFADFVEETELFLNSATLPLRLEDFTVDPLKEFGKIAKVMSVDLDLSGLSIAPPKTKPYRYLAVQAKVPQFRNFINGLDPAIIRRIERCGYRVEGGSDISDEGIVA